MKIETFEKAFDNDKHLQRLSTKQASELIKKYNIYFTIKLKNQFMSNHIVYMNLENKYETVYQLDNTKDFNEQLKQIYKYIDINYESYVFLTDHLEPESLIIERLNIAREILLSNNETLTVKKLQNKSEVKDKKEIEKFMQSFEIGTQTSFSF